MTLDFAPNMNARLSKAINKLVDEALEHEAALQEPRDYLGGSRMGHECLRALGYEHQDNRRAHKQVTILRKFEGGADDADAFLAQRGTPFEGKALRRFRLGHIHEAETVRWLKLAGFTLLTMNEAGRQFGWKIDLGDDARIGGSIDGVFADGPADLGGVALVYPALFEHKIMKDSKWNEFQKHGLAKSHPVYLAQCQVYMDRMELRQAVLFGLNTDTSELWGEIIAYDQAEAERVLERGARVVQARKPEDLPRVFGATPQDIRCKWCHWKDECWGATLKRAIEGKEPKRETTESIKAENERPPWA